MRAPRLRIVLQFVAALIAHRDEPSHPGTDWTVDAFRAVSLPVTSKRNDGMLFVSPSWTKCGRLQKTRIMQQRPSSESADARPYNSRYPEKLPRKRRRRQHGGRRPNTNIAFRSRSTLNSFEEVCQREKKNRSLQGEEFMELLNSMVQDLLDSKNIVPGERESAYANGDGQSHNLSDHMLPRDASSLIRLLGRNGAHDAMLLFCRRYCRDILESSNASKHGSANSKKHAISRADAEEAILFAYTAAIAACSKPPLASLASSMDPQRSTPSEYRSKSFLLSLLNEMEYGYTEDGRSIRPNSFTLSAVLLGIDDVAESAEVLDTFEESYREHDGGIHHQSDIVTVQVYNVVIASCAKDTGKSGNGWQRALSMLQRMRRSGPQPNEQTYASVLQACAENGQMKVAKSLLDEIRQSPAVKPTTKLYIPLLKVCAKRGHSDMAFYLLNIMKDDSLEISTEIMNLYLSSLAKSKLHIRALGVLQEMMSNPSTTPDIVTINTILAACSNAGDFEGAQSLLEQLRDGMFEVPSPEKGQSRLVELRPDLVSYNTVISCADPETALSLIQEMRLTRRKRDGVITPNSVTYVNAISSCRRASFDGDPTLAFEVAMYILDLAREEKVGLNLFVYSASIWMAEAVGDYRTAVELLREMNKVGCSPNRVCYDGVISALARHGLHREALYFYYEMQHLGLAATRKTYQRLVFAIDNTQDPELSKSCQKKAALLDGVLSAMPDRDRKIQVGAPLFDALIRNSNYQGARRAFYSIVGPVDDRCLQSMLRVCSSADPVRWKESILLMHSSDIVNTASGPGLVSSRALSYAVIACAKANEWEEALNLIELYGHGDNKKTSGSKQKEGVVTVAAINSLIRACGRKSRPDIAVQLLNDMSTRYNVDPDEVSYRLAIISCNQAEHREMKCNNSSVGLKWWECALSLLRRMSEDGLKPSLQTYSSVISALEAAGEWQRALGVLRLMPSFAPILGDGTLDDIGTFDPEPANLYCLNAAITACGRGGAWIEALQLWENIRSMQNTENAIRPNFVTVNSLLIALDEANQLELAESIYNDAVRERIVSPWKRRYDSDGNLQKVMDLHQFSSPMAKIAVRSHLDSLLSAQGKKLDDAVFVVGKGKRSEEKPVLMPAILKLLRDEYGIDVTPDEKNKGRIVIPEELVKGFIERKKWK